MSAPARGAARIIAQDFNGLNFRGPTRTLRLQRLAKGVDVSAACVSAGRRLIGMAMLWLAAMMPAAAAPADAIVGEWLTDEGASVQGTGCELPEVGWTDAPATARHAAWV
jgi:hypothetical protein